MAHRIPRFNDIPLVIGTFDDAFEKEKGARGLIVCSGQGFRYTSFQYKALALLRSRGALISMSRKGTPIDRSPLEGWYQILKRGALYNNHIASLEHYEWLADERIPFYNSGRIKSRDLR